MHDAETFAVFRDLLGRLGAAADVHALAEAAILMHDHPRWAVWIPRDQAGWTAARPASSRRPAPELPMLWINAESASELADMMDSADGQAARTAARTESPGRCHGHRPL